MSFPLQCTVPHSTQFYKWILNLVFRGIPGLTSSQWWNKNFPDCSLQGDEISFDLMTTNFICLIISTLHSSSLRRIYAIFFAKLDIPPILFIPPPPPPPTSNMLKINKPLRGLIEVVQYGYFLFVLFFHRSTNLTLFL